MPSEDLSQKVVWHFPDSDGGIGRRRGQASAVGAEDDVPQVIGVSLESGQFRVSDGVSDLDEAIDTGRGEQASVRAETHSVDLVGMAFETGEFF